MTGALVTALGKDPKEATYELDGQTVTASLFPSALLELLDPKPDELLPLVTPETTDSTLEVLTASMGALGLLPPRTLDTPLPWSRHEIEELGEAIQPPCDVSVDVTHGLRHFPSAILTAPKDVRAASAAGSPALAYPNLPWRSSWRGSGTVIHSLGYGGGSRSRPESGPAQGVRARPGGRLGLSLRGSGQGWGALLRRSVECTCFPNGPRDEEVIVLDTLAKLKGWGHGEATHCNSLASLAVELISYPAQVTTWRPVTFPSLHRAS